MTRLSILILVVVNAAIAHAQTPANDLDPSRYLDEKAFEEQKTPTVDVVKQNVVMINGRPYYKFGDDRRSIIVPKTDHLTKADMERAVCSEDLRIVCDPNKGVGDESRKALCDAQGLQEALVARAEVSLTSSMVLYSGLIIQTIQTACGGSGVQQNAKDIQANLEIGIERKSTDPRHPGSQKLYIKPLPFAPQIGAGTTF